MNELWKPRGIEEVIVDAMARALWVSKYADAIESGEITGLRPGTGQDWMDFAPATPIRALLLAGVFAEDCRRSADHLSDTPLVCLWQVFAAALRMDESDFGQIEGRLKDAEDFGHGVAMTSMGHGVGWDDNHPSLQWTVPKTLEHVGWDDLTDGEVA